ncbi:MAG: hypothetical protein J0I98_01910 [Mesorhizobium sp.]|nr:hypothetical protein [Mesorhizobium sp.]MBN9241527.1 hypothetical protein [Mesorhizobium sp.]
MTIHRSTFSKLAFSTFLFVLPLNTAFAQDTGAVAGRLKALLANQGVDLAWTGISGDASSMVMEGVTVKPAAEKDGLPIGNVKLEGVTEQNGGYAIGTVSTEAFSHSEDGTEVDISPFVMHDLTIPAEGSTDPLASILMYKSADLANMTVKVGDKTAFSMEDFTIDVTPPADGKAMEFAGKAGKFTGDLSLVEDSKSKEMIDALGYQTISGNIKIGGSWHPSDGKMELSQYDITVDNAGTFGMTFDISGYTMDFVKSLQEVQKKMAEKPEGADSSTEGMAMLGLLQQLTFNGASIRFDDDSLTNKVLDYAAKQQGMTAKDIANQAKAIVPFGMAQLNNPELTAQVSAAVNKFLDNPKSLEIAAKPASPVPFALLMANGMANPLDLPKTLGLSVTANEN